MPFHCSFAEVPTDVQVIPYIIYAILTMKQQKRRREK